MQKSDGWWFPDGESHLPVWMANPKVRMTLNGRPAYQGQKQIHAMALCKQFRTAVDVGGHVGLWTFNLMHKFDHVHAFEPVAAHRACFLENVPEVRQDPQGAGRVTLHACALGAEAGYVAIKTEPTSSGDSRVDGLGDIPLRTLDSFGLADVDLVKIDTEGYELMVLHGATETIERCQPVIVVEQKPGHARRYGIDDTAALPYLRSLGYKLAKEMSGDYICVPE